MLSNWWLSNSTKVESPPVKSAKILTFHPIWSSDGVGNMQHQVRAVLRESGSLYLPLNCERFLLNKALMEAQIERDILKKGVSIFSMCDSKYSGSWKTIRANLLMRGCAGSLRYPEVRCTPFFGHNFGVFKMFSKVGRYSIMSSPVISIVIWPNEDMMI